VGVSKENNPWEKFVRTQPVDSWHNPWAQSDPILAPVGKYPRSKEIRTIRRIHTKHQVYIVPKDKLNEFLEKYPEFRKQLFKGHKKTQTEEVY